MANSDRGTKREDPDTGKKFYDLNRDPIVSPYTGKTYPRSYFEATVRGRAAAGRAEEEEPEVPDEDEEIVVEKKATAKPDVVSLDEVEAEEKADEDIPEVDDVEEAEDIGDDEADTFLEDDDDDDDDIEFTKVETSDDR